MSSLPSSYKAAFVVKTGAPLEVRDTPLRQPGPREVLVKVLACGVCGTDGHVHQHGLPPRQKALPMVLGHEYVGDVVAVGSQVDASSPIQVGTRVGGAWHGGHDGTCRTCQRGFFQGCDHEEINGVTRDGGFAEYVLLRSEAAVVLPSDVDPVATAPLLCAGVTVFNSLRKQKIEQGNLVAVQGVGALGHLAIQYASRMGYDVVAISSGPSKRDFALQQLGATDYIDTSAESDVAAALQKRGGAACILLTAPNPAIVPGLLGGLQANGTLVTLAPVPGVTINLGVLVGKGLKIAGWPSGHALDSQEAVAFAKSHDVKAMTETYKFSDIQSAMDRLYSGKARFKVVLDMRQ